MNKSKLWTDEQLIRAVRSSRSRRQVLLQLGLAAQGGNYATINRAVKRLDLDTSHWTEQGWNKGQTIGPKRPLEDYLSNKFPIKSHSLKLRLIREGMFEHRCSVCKLTHWNELLVPLELEHRNGDSNDNSLENLCLLCPNCHAQTPTYRGKNQRRGQLG